MLIDDIERYLTLRRSLGFKLERAAEYLGSFARFAAARGERHIRTQTAIEWAQTAPTSGSRYTRLRDVVRAARFLRLEGRAHESRRLASSPGPRTSSSPISSPRTTCAGSLRPPPSYHRHQYYPVQRQRYAMLFGLIAATGLRVTEALDLRLGDILPGGVLRIRETKLRKSRLVPLHPTVQEPLDRYLALRRDFVGLVDCLFLSVRGND